MKRAIVKDEVIKWLLEGDVSVRYQVYRDLLGIDKPDLRKKIAVEGWGKHFLSCRLPNGHWGKSFYQPKWTSTHYTLLDLKNLNISPDNYLIRETLQMVFEMEKGPDGGIRPIGSTHRSDVCLNGMVLNYSAYFKVDESLLRSVVDFILSQQMQDGGFNCRSNGSGATHSSLHTTLSVLEGILEYRRNGYHYRLQELKEAARQSEEFILMHRLFRSDKTGELIHPAFLKLCYPSRWYYDILKALDYFQMAGRPYDDRMEEAIRFILSTRTVDGLWKLAAHHRGQMHFEMEQVGQPSRWNTLRTLRVLKAYKK